MSTTIETTPAGLTLEIGALLGFALAICFIGALLLGRRFRRIQFATF